MTAPHRDSSSTSTSGDDHVGGRRLRVCLVVPGFSTSAGDGCIPALRAFAVGLGRTHDVTVISLRYPHTRTPYDLDGVRVLPLGGAFVTGPRRMRLLATAAATVLRAGPFDVVHGLWADEPGVVAALAGRALGAKTLVSFMGGELAALPAIPYGGARERLGPQLVRTAVGLADRITVGSPWLQGRLPEPWRAKSSVLGLAVHGAQLRGRQREPAAPLRVGLVASLLPVKAPGLLIAAAALVARRGVPLDVRIIGDGPLAERLTDQARRLRVPVCFTGAVPFVQLNAELCGLDVVVQTSWWESQGMAVLEAAATGCAVIGTDVGALASLDSALARTPPGDVSALADALLRAAGDRAGTHAAGRAAAVEVARVYSVDRHLARWRALVDAPGRPNTD